MFTNVSDHKASNRRKLKISEHIFDALETQKQINYSLSSGSSWWSVGEKKRVITIG